MSETNATVKPSQYRLRVELAYRLARHLVARRQVRQQTHTRTGAEWDLSVTSNWDTYAAWRYRALDEQFRTYFGKETVAGKAALDFGCGDGALCIVLLDAGAQRAHGVDLNEASLNRFAARLATYSGQRRPTFSRSTSLSRIDEPDQSFDAIYCLDVLEHIIDYGAIIREWHRVLRPGGSVYIWWQPYWHPFGHHSFDWIPIPWAHVLLSDDEMTEVCARIVDWPDFDAPIWDRNPDGTRRNRFRVPGAGGGFLNKLTVGEFERHCKDTGFRFERREFHPFSSRQPARAISSLLTKVPFVRDFFTACAVYELVRT